MKRGEKWLSKKIIKKCYLKNIRSESFSIRTSKGKDPASELVLLMGGLPSEIALQAGASSPKLCIEG